ncbi:MAG: PepSY-associated TM helix domain-containing protein [Pseudomonadota bacterium]
MFPISQHTNKTLLAIHGWSGISLGILLYAILVTGVLAVFADEIGDWSAPLPSPVEQGLPVKLNDSLRLAAATVAPDYLTDVAVFRMSGGRVFSYFHDHFKQADKTIAKGTVVIFDNEGREIRRRDAIDTEAFGQEPESALSEFFVDLHVRLHVPNPWGFLLTGVLGMAMMVATISGLVMHRHLLRELFTLRRKGQPVLSKRDSHAAAASWSLPFCFLLAFTGSFFSFAGSFGLPALAMVAFGGDMERMEEEILGGSPEGDTSASHMVDVDLVLQDARNRSAGVPTFLEIQGWGQANAQIAMNLLPQNDALTGPVYVYDGVSGDFVREKPALGKTASAGGSLVSLMAPLHFGFFAGVASKAVWFALGAAVAYVTFTGMTLWLTRRRIGDHFKHLEKSVYWAGYGFPCALAAASLAFFVSPPGTVHDVMMTVFLATLALTLAQCWMTDVQKIARRMLGQTGALLLLLPAIRMLSGGPSWFDAAEQAFYSLIAIDTMILIGALVCLMLSFNSLKSQKREFSPAALVNTSLVE